MGAKIIYKNYALIDKKSTSISSSDSRDESPFSRLDDLKGDDVPRRLASFEEQFMRADVEYPFYCAGDPKNETECVGYVSKNMCDNAGLFDRENPPTLNITLGGNAIISDGITLYFSPIAEEYATEVEVTWYLPVPGEEDIAVTETFYPDSNIFFCKKKVEGYVGLDIAFKRWSFGNRWARLCRIDYGHEEVYEGDAVFTASVSESVNLVSDQLQVNTSSVVLWADPDTVFQEQQEFEIWYGDKMIAKHYVTDLKIQGERVTITGNDVLSKLDKSNIQPVSANQTFEKWVQTILSDAEDPQLSSIPLDEDSDATILNMNIDASIEKEMTRREALTVLCLYVGAYVDTSRSGGILIRSTKNALPVEQSAGGTSVSKIIPETQVFSGDSTVFKEPYRSLAIKYKASEKEVTAKPIKNTAYSGRAAELVLDASALRINNTSSLAAFQYFYKLQELYKEYYFHSGFYSAKAVMDENIQMGDRIMINGKDVFLIQRTMNLDGDKLIADGTYKLVEGR